MTLEQSDKLTVATPPRSVTRKDIQGLRAIAVVAVIFDHLVGWPSGGFVGVDVFFVISGFLITGLLLREYDREGRISFVGFYKRRVRRIVPAATVTLLITAGVAFLVFNVGRANQTFWDAVSSFFFFGNWHFAAAGTDYFLAGGPVSPLQHFWSLSVEEQFYFVWPWLMLVIFVIGGRSSRWNSSVARRFVGAVMIVIIVASFGWSMWETSTNPTWSYFSTFSRAWELGIGALLAVIAGSFSAIPSRLRPVLAWLGLLGIGASVFLITDSMSFPGPWAVAPVVSTAIVIAAGTGAAPRFLFPVTNPVVGFVGDISYSLYLWHFPVIILLASVIPEASPTYYVVVVLLMGVLAVLSYYGVEQAVLKSRWLRTVSEAERRRSELKKQHRNRRRGDTSPVWAYAGTAALALGVAFLVIVAFLPRVSPAPTYAVAVATDSPVTSTEPVVLDAAGQIKAGLQDALNSTSWPTFDPPADGSVNTRVSAWIDDNCLSVVDKNYDSCVYGSQAPTKTAVILGDSVATSWLPAIVGALEPRGYQVRLLTYEKCPFGDLQVTSSETVGGPLYEGCEEHRLWAAGKVQELNPDLIILSDSFYGTDRLISQSTGDAAEAEWTGGSASALASLPAASAKVVLMSPPGAGNMTRCYTPISKPADCNGQLGDRWNLVAEAESAGAAQAGVPFVDTRDWFCISGVCPAFTGTTAIYADSAHLTQKESEGLAAVLGDKLVEVGAVQ